MLRHLVLVQHARAGVKAERDAGHVVHVAGGHVSGGPGLQQEPQHLPVPEFVPARRQRM